MCVADEMLSSRFGIILIYRLDIFILKFIALIQRICLHTLRQAIPFLPAESKCNARPRYFALNLCLDFNTCNCDLNYLFKLKYSSINVMLEKKKLDLTCLSDKQANSFVTR